MSATLYFYGGAGAVTGSNFLLDTGGTKILVDCGLRQGAGEAENWKDFAYDPKEVSHLFITHAHIDHIGRVPKLVRDGFAGKIISTHATRALAEPLLLDAMELMAHDAEIQGRPPLYEAKDIAQAMQQWEVHSYHEKMSLPGGVTLEFLDSGHILGSAMVRVTRPSTTLGVKGSRNIVFSSDLGGGNSPLLSPAEAVRDATYLVIESVYGDRTRQDEDRRERLEDVIEETAARGGSLLIPAFSTERTQDLLFEIRTLMVEKRIPTMPVYVDSPLAQKMTEAFLRCPEYFAPTMRARVAAGEDIFNFPQLHFAQTLPESQAIVGVPAPKIVLAGSGMGGGGRVGTHQAAVLPDKNSTYLVVGYQAAGTPGRRLLEGAKALTLRHGSIPVRCKIEALYGYSAHMDGEDLLQFANHTADTVEEIFVVQGEPVSASFLAQRIRDYLSVKATTPAAGDKVTLQL